MILSAIAVIVLLWSMIGVRHLSRLRKEVLEKWELIRAALAKRADLLPNLVETVRGFSDQKEDLVEKIIQQRKKASKLEEPGAKKIEYELDLTASINELIAVEKSVNALGKDTNFLELKKEINDLEQNIEEQTRLYNEMVRHYNKQRNLWVWVVLAKIFGYKEAGIFEIES